MCEFEIATGEVLETLRTFPDNVFDAVFCDPPYGLRFMGSDGLNSPRAGAGRGGGARNHHPTLKPIALCEYLARLVMPPSPGAILIPFAGSGSEMIGASKAGWPYVVGIEREAEYVNIARARLAHWVAA